MPFSSSITHAVKGYSSLSQALSQNPADLIDDIRGAWGMPDGPVRVIGQLRARMLGGGREIWSLENLEHPESGAGLLYPALAGIPNNDGARAANAFVPHGPSRRIIKPSAEYAETQWAIAELELSPRSEREKHRNPWELMVRSGTLRPLSEIPGGWKISVTGTEAVRRISALARDEIEEHVRTQVLEEDTELARLHAAKVDEKAKLKAGLLDFRKKAQAEQAAIEAQVESDRDRGEQAKRRVEDLAEKFEAEQQRFAVYQSNIEQETYLMETNYRHLQELLSEKGSRLVALGLADPEDVAAVLPDLVQINEDNSGAGLNDVLEGDFSRLAPLLQSQLAEKGLLYSQTQLRDFLAVLRTRDILVLAGDSGSGKTSLVRAAAEAIGGVCTVIPVKPNWTGPEDLLGYYNPIERSYQATPFLLALLAAARSPQVPHFICLDEMNLARVEHYFADFLSLLEDRSGSPEIALYTADEERHVVVEQGLFLEVEAEARRRAGLGNEATFEEMLRNDQANAELHRLGGFTDSESVLLHHARLRRSLANQMRMPTSLLMPQNVWIFGAVNMDDTTHQLSPKVLDRVQVLRFRNPMLADWEAIEAEIEDAKQALPDDVPPLRMTAYEIGPRKEYPNFDRHDHNVKVLSHISRLYLDPLGVEFGMRAIRQSQGYMLAAEAAGIGADEALDNVFKHKILPKIAFDTSRSAGSGRPRREVLLELRAEMDRRFEDADLDQETSSVAELDRMIMLSEGNNGIINYWLR
jgi:energy-coupling factor transporter ATP-binding protein EcfA2